MVTFKEYVEKRRAGHDAQGDFVRLAMSDSTFPDIETLDELTAYIERRRGFQAVEAGRVVWEEYVSSQRKLARTARKT